MELKTQILNGSFLQLPIDSFNEKEIHSILKSHDRVMEESTIDQERLNEMLYYLSAILINYFKSPVIREQINTKVFKDAYNNGFTSVKPNYGQNNCVMIAFILNELVPEDYKPSLRLSSQDYDIFENNFHPSQKEIFTKVFNIKSKKS